MQEALLYLTRDTASCIAATRRREEHASQNASFPKC